MFLNYFLSSYGLIEVGQLTYPHSWLNKRSIVLPYNDYIWLRLMCIDENIERKWHNSFRPAWC